ncbi:hypothetical protein, partial [Sphaerotilus sulfidivorans]|uniref:hypothetical protein n=1 Tax=Sphaerotilus sulfidivorans TaxID=639200 RepID=UPI0033979F25
PDAVRRKLARRPSSASQRVVWLWDTEYRGKVRPKLLGTRLVFAGFCGSKTCRTLEATVKPA